MAYSSVVEHPNWKSVSAGVDPMTSAIPKLGSNKPTGSWSFCRFVIHYEFMNKQWWALHKKSNLAQSAETITLSSSRASYGEIRLTLQQRSQPSTGPPTKILVTLYSPCPTEHFVSLSQTWQILVGPITSNEWFTVRKDTSKRELPFPQGSENVYLLHRYLIRIKCSRGQFLTYGL